MFKSIIASLAVLTCCLGNPAMAKPSNCWIIPAGERSDSFRCDVVERTNANGHTVYDITHFEGNGAQFSVVLWTDGTAEVFVNGEVVEFPWYYDHDGDTRIDLPGGDQFVF